MTVKLIAENILTADHFISATEQAGEYIGQPDPDGDNAGAFRLLAKGDIADLSYSGAATSDGAADNTTTVGSVLAIFGDDYFIGATLAASDFVLDTGDFTEDDTPGRLTLTDANTVTVATLDTDEQAQLYKDYGAGHFSGDFEHHLRTQYTADTDNFDDCAVWALGNDVASGGMSGIELVSGDYLALVWLHQGGEDNLHLLECVDGDVAEDYSVDLDVSTNYHVKIVRNESVGTYGTLYCYIYSDAAMTTLVDTLTVTLREKIDYRYYFWILAEKGAFPGTAWSGVSADHKIVSAESKTITDFAQTSGTLTHSAFTYKVNAGTQFTLTVPFATRDFAVELIAGGDAGDATFKWSHDGGTTWLGRDNPHQATWLANKIECDGYADACQLIECADGALLLFYNSAANTGSVRRSTDGGITWGALTSINTTGFLRALKLASGRILAYGATAATCKYSDDHGAAWVDFTFTAPGQTLDCIELQDGKLLFVYSTGANEVYCAVSGDGGMTIGTGIAVAATTNNQIGPSVIQLSNGDILCAYYSDEDSAGDYEIKLKKSSTGGATWGAVVAVINYSADLATPSLCLDINGDVYCAAVISGNIVYTRSTDNGDTWAATAGIIDTADNFASPSLAIIGGHQMVCVFANATDGKIETVRRGIWEAYSGNACPCAIEAGEQKLICGAGIVWHGGVGIAADAWTFSPAYDYAMSNLIEDSPSKPWRSGQDNIACAIVLDLGANVRHYADGAAFFGCNVRTLSFQMNASDAWGSPSVDEAVSFDIAATGEVDSVTGNIIADAALLAGYKDHALAGLYLRMTSGTDSGLTWKILDNAGSYIYLDTTAEINAAIADTFCIFQRHIAKTFTGGAYRFLRINIAAQYTAEGYYQLGMMLPGRSVALAWEHAPGWKKTYIYGIEYLRTPYASLIPVRGADRQRIFELSFPASDDSREESAALIDYVNGKNIVLIPDSSDLTDCYLVKHTGNIEMRHRFRNNFDFALTFEEIL